MDEKEKELEKTKEAAASTVAAASAVVAKSITPAGKLKPNTELADQMAMQIQNQQNNNIKKLVESMKTLTDRMKVKPKLDVKGKENGSAGILGAIKDSLSDIIKDKLSPLTQLTSKEGILKTATSMSGGGLTGMILGGALEKVQQKKAEQAEQKKWVDTYLESTRGGKKLAKEMGSESAKKEAEKLYKEKITLEKEVSELKTKQKEKEATGIIGAGLSKEEQKKLAAGEKRLGILAGGPSRVSAKAKEETAAMVKKEQVSKPAIGSPGTAMTGEKINQEPLNDLVDINQEQLESLKKIFSALSSSEEDRLEEENRRNKEARVETVSKKEEKKEEKKGLLQTVLENLPGVGGIVGGLAGKVLPAAGGLISGAAGAIGGAAKAGAGLLAKGAATAAPIAAKMALPAAAIGAAGYAGYKAGGLLNEYVLNPAAAAITGSKDETLGSAIYSGADKIKGMLGFKTDAEKEKEAEKESYMNLYKKRIAAGGVSPQLAKKMEELGVKVPENMIKPGTPPTTAPVTTGTPITKPVLDSNITKQQISPAPTMTPTPRATEQTEEMRRRTTEVEDAKTQKPIVIPMPAPAPSGGMNSISTNTTVVRPETRTPEPTFNKILSRNFTFA